MVRRVAAVPLTTLEQRARRIQRARRVPLPGGVPWQALSLRPGELVNIMLVGEPVPKQRPRIGRGGTYTPTETVNAEDLWRLAFRSCYPHLGVDRDSLFWMTLDFYLASKHRPDWDNLGKLCSDAGNRHLWWDDSQVVEVTVRKHLGQEHPSTHLVVGRIA